MVKVLVSLPPAYGSEAQLLELVSKHLHVVSRAFQDRQNSLFESTVVLYVNGVALSGPGYNFGKAFIGEYGLNTSQKAIHLVRPRLNTFLSASDTLYILQRVKFAAFSHDI